MVSKELSELYERLSIREELHKEAIKFGNFVSMLGAAIMSMSLIYALVSSTFNLLKSDRVLIGGVIFGFLVLFIGQKIIVKKTLLAPFSVEEQEFLNAVDSLKDIETFQKEGIEFSRIEAAKSLSQ